MAHIVPNPPPKKYREAEITKFTVFTKDGVAHFQVWGLPKGATDDEFAVALTGTGTEGPYGTESKISGGAFFDLKKFVVTGLRDNQDVSVFRQTNFANPAFGANWVPHTRSVKVKVAADTSARKLAEGKLKKYEHNDKISFYPFGSMQRTPPVSEKTWQDSVIETLEKMRGNALGAKIIGLIQKDLVIYPWVPSADNATSEVLFSPQASTEPSTPGDSPHETLFHEFIHVLEDNYDQYTDANGFQFDGSDFMTVNATNVYSCLLGGGLRKDHRTEFLPKAYFDDPQKHYNDFAVNYRRAKIRNRALYDVVKDASNLWNPFKYITP